MSAVRSFLGAVWSYGVSLPLYVMWSVVLSSVRAAFDFFYPRGYRLCNELADVFVEECTNRPAGQSVRLPRAILGRGTHFAAIAPINGGAFGGYGCAQVINWGASLGGLSYLWVAMGAEWNVSPAASYVAGFLSGQAQMFAHEVATDGVLITVVMTPLWVVLGCLFGMAWTVLPAAAFWYVSLRFVAARNAKAQLEGLPFNSIQVAMYRGSDFERVAELVAPQVTLGYLVYISLTVGIILYPIQTWVRSLF